MAYCLHKSKNVFVDSCGACLFNFVKARLGKGKVRILHLRT